MKWDQLESQWKELAGSARAHWPKLTDDDWQQISGSRRQLIGRVQQRYGLAQGEAEQQVDQWADALIDVAPVPESR